MNRSSAKQRQFNINFIGGGGSQMRRLANAKGRHTLAGSQTSGGGGGEERHLFCHLRIKQPQVVVKHAYLHMFSCLMKLAMLLCLK